MLNKAFITNIATWTLKKRLEQIIEHSEELKFPGFCLRSKPVSLDAPLIFALENRTSMFFTNFLSINIS